MWDGVPPPLDTSSPQHAQQSVKQEGAHATDITGQPKKLSHSPRVPVGQPGSLATSSSSNRHLPITYRKEGGGGRLSRKVSEV